MTGPDNRPVPDPTILTTEALSRGLSAERDYTKGEVRVLEQRLTGIDIATKLLNETVNRVPTALQEAITHLRELDEEKFKSVAQQFDERDTRSERESRDNKVAVDAAFAAQKEAAAKQDESNAKAIDKSEAATTETINKLGELFNSSNKALSDKIDDLKLRVTKVETTREATSDDASFRLNTRHTQAGVNSVYVAIAGVIVTILIAVVTIAIATHGFTK